MSEKNKINGHKVKSEELAEEIDFSEGFGGIPENVSLTKNIGCASNSGHKANISSKNSPKIE